MSESTNKAFFTLEDMQRESLRILKLFASFCDEFGIRYSLAGGTLLGAVRHGGFIPWDEDVDVMLPRPDYERFRSLEKEIYDRTGLLFQGYPNAQAENPPYTMLVNPSIKRKFDYLGGIYYFGIDVFPIDGLPADDEEVRGIFKRADKLRRKIRLSHTDLTHASNPARLIMKNAYAVVDAVASLGRKNEQRLTDLARQYAYEDSSYIGDVAWGLYGPGERMVKKDFEVFDTISFEGQQFAVTCCWDDYLSGIYGDYMQLPPEEDRHPHKVDVWV